MNEDLQAILNIIQQSEHLSAEEKATLLNAAKGAGKELEITAVKPSNTEKVKHTSDILLEETITELEQKRKIVEAQSRELEIESSLEKVRAVTLSMNKPDDMLDVCRVISEQLEHLDVQEVRNVQTAIFYETKGTYINYEFYAKHDKTLVTEVNYKDHPVGKAFADQMMKGPNEIFIHSFNGKEVRDWYEYQKSTNVFLDTYLENVNSLNYYWYSLGPVALGMSTYNPLSEEGTNLFKRFLKVFELSYRRYLDIEKAEAQVRESQIQLALERVRARTMAMHRSEELQDAASLLFQQVKELDIETWGTGFNIWEEDGRSLVDWMTGPDGLFIPPCKIPLDEFWLWRESSDAKRRGEGFLEIRLEGDKLRESYEYLASLPDLKIVMEAALLAGLKLPEYQVNNYVFFPQGSLLFITHKPQPGAHDIFKRFGKVFEQTYTRFLDLQKAEAQAREAKIEAALERTRTQSMLMQHSRELDDTLRVFHEQVLMLDINSAFSFLWLPDEEKDRHIFWAAWEENKNGLTAFKSKAIDYTLDRNEPATMQCLVDWKSNEPVYSYAVPPKGVENYFATWQELIDGVEKLTPEDFAGGLYYVEAFMKYGCFGVMVATDLTEDEKKILARFAIEFERTYTRFLDLKKAEAQAREAQIELGLERVRARAMAMQKSDDLARAVAIIFEELDKLNIGILRCGIGILNRENRSVNVWTTSKSDENTTVQISGDESMDSHPLLRGAFNAWLQQEEYSYVLHGKDLTDYYKTQEAANFKLPESQSLLNVNEDLYQYYFLATFQAGGLFAFRETAFPDEGKKVMKRFAGVFNLTYKRFLDLQKAEAQAREAQIEAALERVRSRSMGMQKSEELSDVSHVINLQLQQLNFRHYMAGFFLDYKDSDDFSVCRSDSSGLLLEKVVIPYFDHPIFTTFKNSKETGLDFYTTCLTFDEKNKWVDHALPRFREAPPEVKSVLYSSAGYASSCALLKNVGLFIENFEGIPFSQEENAILMRFGKVFEQTYTRFLDLQKAEEQARESQIEAALERVRSRSMAMQKSDELKDVIQVVFEQFVHLNIHVEHTGFIMDYKERDDMHIWLADQQRVPSQVTIPYFDSPHWNSFNEAKEKGIDFFTNYLTFEEKNRFYQDLFNHIPGVPEETREYYFSCPGLAISTVLLENIGLYIENHSGIAYSDEENATLMRFGKVFQQTYTRFLDLQKAEAQARESQIEAALERVRSRSMAMQKSDELTAVAGLLFAQVNALGIKTWTAGFNVWNDDNNSYVDYITSPSGGFIEPYTVYSHMTEVLMEVSEARKSGIEFLAQYAEGERLKQTYLALSKCADEKQYEKMLQEGFQFPTHQYDHFVFGSKVSLMFITYEPVAESHDIFKRFGKVFEQTYTRFLDIQKAEAQALEAIKRASVDRVRAEIASMRTTKDLERITPLIWSELTMLGVPFIRCGVFIMDEELQQVNTLLSNRDGKAIAAFHQPFNTPGDIGKVIMNWRKKEMYRQHWDETQFNDFTKGLVEQGAITSGEKYLTENRPTDLYLHFLPFLQGMMYVGNNAPLDDNTLQSVQNLADAFSTAYARYEDFNKLEAANVKIEKTLVDLKQAQSQLVQSEKMASLGELTAGIAHEIQNPLNFVNNFSELNKELLDELNEEIEKGNYEEVKNIAKDVTNNEEKISHHGKRADAIVKGMLQHSRSSSATKEPTDINQLADEYLRLSYHGLRAKDNSFNATLKTDYDEAIGPIHIIPQDIGRVILNLLTNAFYAVAEKKKKQPENYDPRVSIITKKIHDTSGGYQVELTVTDNGNGIPRKALDKIFQPFFTTKPTGEGTGLGLSLSYDIIKAHGGEIKVETKEGDGTEFIIVLPIV